MIKSEKEYKEAVKRLKEEMEAIEATRVELEKEGLTPEQVKNALDPLLSFRGQLEDEVTTYEKIKRGNIGAIENFYGIGRSLIAMRISVGITQTELAKKLGMESSNFCRLEKNEFHGAKPELINRVLQALGFRARTTFERVA